MRDFCHFKNGWHLILVSPYRDDCSHHQALLKSTNCRTKVLSFSHCSSFPLFNIRGIPQQASQIWKYEKHDLVIVHGQRILHGSCILQPLCQTPCLTQTKTSPKTVPADWALKFSIIDIFSLRPKETNAYQSTIVITDFHMKMTRVVALFNSTVLNGLSIFFDLWFT